MNDDYFRQILGVSPEADRDGIRQAYRKLVMENHPDRFPPEKKALQDLAMITLTEAYTALMSSPAPDRADSQQRSNGPSVRRPVQSGPSNGNHSALAPHGDPSYAYYKQGFINFSLAIHGIAEINRKISAGRVPRFTRRYTAREDIASSLAFLRAAHGYFSRVVEDHPHSVWNADANAKLRRIERFTKLYRRILANLSRR
ncbi:MAG TPA: J domain-containing protein [Spirochaetia bacterium]|nr:J domain-containing protein [Spirochaetia bacterium]